MPDFDIDFCEEKRDQVFEYLRTKYKDGVAHIITFGKLKARMALKRCRQSAWFVIWTC